jgi:hypothetical protein
LIGRFWSTSIKLILKRFMTTMSNFLCIILKNISFLVLDICLANTICNTCMCVYGGTKLFTSCKHVLNLVVYNYMCNQCLSPLMLWVRILIRARCTTLCDKVCQWPATGWWFSPGPPVSSTNKTDRHDITEILLKVALNTTKQTNKSLILLKNNLVTYPSRVIYHSNIVPIQKTVAHDNN